MQQAIVAERRGSETTTSASGNAFVINLVSSTTPVALIRPDHAGLNRFTFFVSRRREDGRERFRLHMGYFDSQEEAERLLDIVRGIYPGAWAGLAPGRRLAAASTTSTPPSAAVAAVPATAPTVAAAAAEPSAAVPAVSVTVREPVTAASRSRGEEQQAAARALSNIRKAIAALGDSARIPVLQAAATVQSMPAAAQPAAAPSAAVPTVMAPTVVAPTVVLPIPVALAAKMPSAKTPPSHRPSATVPPAAAELSDTAALRVLEGGARNSAAHPPAAKTRPSPVPAAAGSDRQAAVPVATRAAGQPPREDKPCYAVQLMWSVQPIAMTQVPQLAIFSAYTLYGAEGNRDGRRWYGLRLGFFTDAVSAKQVAHYVRADFSTVSVVPVTVREREQARLAAARASGTPAKPVAEAAKASAAAGRTATGEGARTKEFELIDDKESLTIKTAKPGGAVQLRPGVPVRATRGAPGKRAKQRPPGQIHARNKTRAMTLEETLEILGAGQLQVDDEPGLQARDPDKRHPGVDPLKSRASKLSRLFERLSDRLGN